MKNLIKYFSFGIFFISSFLANATDTITYEELLETSKPAPNPIGLNYSSIESQSENQRKTVAYDLITKKESTLPFRQKHTSLLDDSPQLGSVFSEDSLIDFDSNEQTRGAATVPTQITITTSQPWNTIYKLVMRFNVAGTDYFYNCSAWSSGNFQLVTAGHCIYNFDPNDDGDTSDQKWADEVWAYAGQTDRVTPNGCGGYCADRPYGWARSVHLRSYSGWTVDQNHDHDWAMITLDRNMGQRTGWMGRSSTLTTSVNFSGYPTETPHVPAGVNVQYYGYDTNNVVSSTATRIELAAFIYGGHSGGPSWKYNSDTGDRHVVGIHSTSNRTGTAHDTLLTSGKRDDINTWTAEDSSVRPPVNRGDITESLFDGLPHKSINNTTVGKLSDLTFNYQILNGGFASVANNINIDFYASTNETISTSDYFLGSKSISGISGVFSYRTYASTVTIPSSLPAGDYSVGWTMSTSGEYPSDQQCYGYNCSNMVAIVDQTLTVEDCTLDIYEGDDSQLSSTSLNPNLSQNHSICATGDKDWYKIIISNNPSAVTLTTSGATGDTVINLYNYNLSTVIETNDDGGSGLFSEITRVCGQDELGPGTYYLRVEEYLNNGIIQNYQTLLTTSSCVNDLIFEDGFE